MVNVMSLKWDNLIIIDACRFDTFKKINTIPGKLTTIMSLGSCTAEWVGKSFRTFFKDVLYISANPHISYDKIKIMCNIVPFSIIEVWKIGWDNVRETVPANEVNKVVLEHITDKRRKIIHYMQPHHPFIGKKILNKKMAGFTQWKGEKPEGKTAWCLFKKGLITKEEMVEAYESNLEYVLNHIKKILPKLNGTILITSDHGNMFGEKGIYSHPCGLKHPELIEVPLLEVEK